MAEWGFRCYLDEGGGDVVHDWFSNASEQAQVGFKGKIRILRSLHGRNWRRDPYDTLSDDGAGLGEIRFKADGLQQRPLGFHIFDAKVFVIVICATKKGNKWDPKNAVALAQERKREILEDGRPTRELDWLIFQ